MLTIIRIWGLKCAGLDNRRFRRKVGHDSRLHFGRLNGFDFWYWRKFAEDVGH